MKSTGHPGLRAASLGAVFMMGQSTAFLHGGQVGLLRGEQLVQVELGELQLGKLELAGGKGNDGGLGHDA